LDCIVFCPYCGEEIELYLDEGGGSAQDYVEDCQVCCKPMRVRVFADEEGALTAEAARLDQ
jgi:Cysteine-rich CPXCG